MDVTRKSFQGVSNIIRFNPNFFIAAILVLIAVLWAGIYFQSGLLTGITIVLFIVSIVLPLLVSWYVYDASDLYQLPWLQHHPPQPAETILNINAGFDETTALLQHMFPQTTVIPCDFFNEARHTEPSIQRARRIYPPFPGTIRVNTTQLPFADQQFDHTLAILAAHEIRDREERIHFLKELKRVTNGKIYVTEHLRDANNYIAYTIGAFHFHSRKEWLHNFAAAGLVVEATIKTTPFITTFILSKNGDTF